MHLTLKATIAMLTLLTRNHMVIRCLEIDFFGPFQNIPLGYVWFSKNLRENARERKYKGKIEGNKKWRKIKNGLKVNKLFLFFTSNSFYLF